MRPLAIIMILVLLLPAIPLFGSETATATEWTDPYVDDLETVWWNATFNPWYINSSVHVNATGHLIIGSGAEIVLDTSVAITVDGMLDATNAVFRKGDNGEWGGISLNPSSEANIIGCDFINGSSVLDIRSDDVVVRNTIVNCSEVTGATIGVDVKMVSITGASPTIDNVEFVYFKTPYDAFQSALYLDNTPSSLVISNCTFLNTDINAGGTALLAFNSEAKIENSVFEYAHASYNAIRILSDSQLSLVNTTKTDGATNIEWDSQVNVLDAPSTVDVYWPVHIFVGENIALPIDTAKVDITNATGSGQPPEYTDAGGEMDLLLLGYQYIGTATEFSNSPYNFTASKTLYHPNASNGVPIAGPTDLFINLTLIDIDLVPEPGTFVLNITGPSNVHLLGEEARIEINVTNSGDDNASFVTISFEDNHTYDDNPMNYTIETPDGDMEPMVSNRSSVKFEGFFDALTPGWHNISIIVDQPNAIDETNENNNIFWNATYFRVNMPPGLNQTYNASLAGDVNGTISLNGTAWDNRTDLDLNVTLLQVEYSVDGLGPWSATLNTSTWTEGIVNDTIMWNLTYDTTLLPDGMHNMTVMVDDGNHTTNMTIPFTTDNNLPPTLTNITIEPAAPSWGNVTSNYTITVNYTDSEDLPPSGNVLTKDGNITLNITGPNGYNITLNMTQVGVSSDYDLGEPFNVTFMLPENGTYTFHIWASDGVEMNKTINYTLEVNNSAPNILSPYGVSDTYVGPGDNVTFFAIYQDADGDNPDNGTWVNVIIDGVPHSMDEPTSPDYVAGVNYTLDRTFTLSGLHQYYFNFSDGNHSTLSDVMNITVSTPPNLFNDTIEHNGTGANPQSISRMYFNTTYNDTDDDSATVFSLEIIYPGNSTNIPGSPFNMMRDGAEDNINGTNYTFDIVLPRGFYNYRFNFSDGFSEATTGWQLLQVENTPTNFSFIDIEALSDAVFNITWNDKDPDDNATIGFQYSIHENGTSPVWIGNVSEGEDGENDYYLWDASALTNGTYYLFAVVNDTDDGITPNTPVITNYTMGLYVNHNPIVDVVSPNVDVVVNKGYNITWNTSDPDGDTITVQLYYDSNTSPGGETSIVASQPANGIYAWNTTLVPNGEYYLVAMATDPYGTVYQARGYSSNTVRVAHPDVDISLSLSQSFAFPDAILPLTGTVVFSPDDIYDDTDLNIDLINQTGYLDTIVVDSTGDFITNITVPATVGAYTIRVWAEIDGDLWEETIDFTVEEPPLPDFSVNSVELSSDSNPLILLDDDVTFEAKIYNNGVASEALVKLYIDGVQYSSPKTESLAEDEEVVVSWTWNADTAGTHNYNVSVYPTGTLADEDDSDNELSADFSVSLLADFDVESIVLSNDNPKEGDNVSIIIKISNNGSLDAACSVLVYIGNDDDDPLYNDTIALGVGASESLIIYWPSATRGTHIIHVELDGAESVSEKDEDNNEASITLDVEKGEDSSGAPTIGIGMMIAILIAIAGVIALVAILRRNRY